MRKIKVAIKLVVKGDLDDLETLRIDIFDKIQELIEEDELQYDIEDDDVEEDEED